MQIVSIELIDRKRLARGMIKRFYLNCVQKVMLFLGSNGSGKSTILRELSPLPADKDDYKKSGSKTIVIRKNGKTYTLKSTFSPRVFHSFKTETGEELNPGGTASIQKDLARTYFGITPEIHELSLGTIKFTLMSPSDKRSWLTRLSEVDYTYAVGVYQKVKERHRDVTGAIRTNQSKSVIEVGKGMTPDQEQALREEITGLKTVLDWMLDTKPNVHFVARDLQELLSKNEQKLYETSTDLIKTRLKHLGDFDISSEQELESRINQVHSTISFTQMCIEKSAKELEEIQEVYRTFNKNSAHNVQEMRQCIADKKANAKKLLQGCKYDLQWEDPEKALSALEACVYGLVDTFKELPANIDSHFSRSKYENCKQQIAELQGKLQNLQDEKNKTNARRIAFEQARDTHEIECPKCEHRWIKGFDQVQYERCLAYIQALVVRQEQIEKDLDTQKKYCEEFQNYVTIYRQYLNVVKACPILEPIWSYFVLHDTVFKEPGKAGIILEDFWTDLKLHTQAHSITKEVDDLEELLSKINTTDQQKSTTDLQTIEKIEAVYTKQHSELLEHKKHLKDLETFKKAWVSIKTNAEQIKHLQQERKTAQQNLIETLRKDAYNRIIRTLQMDLVQKENKLAEVSLQNNIVQKIQQQLQELESEKKVLTAIMKELSPIDGLIAKGMLGMIKSFIRQMNSFIRKIWLYPMEVLSCSVENEDSVELDYKFPVKAGTDDDIIPDVGKLSTGMGEMINLAFRVVSLKYLKLHDAWLMLDEFSANMDEAHRKAAFHAIGGILADSQFSQIFLVSHFHESYGSLTNTQVTVICPANITVPIGSNVNQHAKIE